MVKNKIQPIAPNIDWSESACLHSVLEHTDDMKGVFVIFWTRRGKLMWSQANCFNYQLLWAFQRMIHKLMHRHDELGDEDEPPDDDKAA